MGQRLWDNDFSFDEFGEEGEGIYQICRFLNLINLYKKEVVMKRKAAVLIMALLIIIFVPAMCTPAIAKGKTGIVKSGGHLYFYKNGKKQTGWIRYKNNTYYAHKTGSKKYPKGSLTRKQFRIRGNNKWYGFDQNGRMYKKDYYRVTGPYRKTLVLKIRKNHTVQYIYTGKRGYRYSTAELRYQYARVGKNYRTVEGMQCIPPGWVDCQQ